MTKQDENILGSLKGALDEGADRLKETAKDVKGKAKEASASAGKKVRAAGKTAKAVAAKTRKKAETPEEGAEAAKAPAKRGRKPAKGGVSKNLKSKVVFQFYGQIVDADEVLKKATKAAQKACPDQQIKSLEIYVNGHEGAAYYVVNGEGKSEYRIDL